MTHPALRIVGGVIAGVALLFALGVFVLTRTDWGRERVRILALERLASQVAGDVEVDRIHGNLLSGATLEGVRIADSAGLPFLVADTVSLHYSLRSLLSEELYFSDVRLVRPVIVLDRPPGEKWNFERLFPQDTTAADTMPGFGSWVRFEDLVIVDGTVIVRQPWQPAGTEDAPEPPADTRTRIVSVPGGWQSVWEFLDLDAHFPFVRFADPDSATRRIDVASLSTVALPFQPPAARVRDLAGTFVIGDDEVRLISVRLDLPGTRVLADGVYAIDGTGDVRARAQLPSLALADFRWLRPSLPDGRGAIESAGIARVGDVTRIDLDDIDLRIEDAHLAGGIDVQLGRTIRFGPSAIAFVDLRTSLLERLVPSIAPPVDGRMNGHLRLTGSPDDLDVAGRVALTQPNGAISVVRADGGIGSIDDGLRLDGLELRLDPLHGDLLAQLAPAVPLDGTITGMARLTGTTTTGLDVDANLIHDNGAPPSHVLAEGRIDLRSGIAAQDLHLIFTPLQTEVIRHIAPGLPLDGTIVGRATVDGTTDNIRAAVDVTHVAPTGRSQIAGDASWSAPSSRFVLDFDLPVVSLETVGEFVPAAGLRGTAAGTLEASGTPADFVLDMDLAANGGSLEVAGAMGLNGTERYDLVGSFTTFDAAAVSTRLPSSKITGVFGIRGTGTDLATMNAVVRADLEDTSIENAAADSTHLLVRLADGLATAEVAEVRMASARIELAGSFGIVAGRSGELSYTIAVDSLSDFGEYIPGDTTIVAPRPLLNARRVMAARADSVRIARETEVQRMALGYPPPPELVVDSFQPMRRDTVSGTVRAEGVLRGNVEQFDIRGTAVADRVLASGHWIASGEASYEVTGFGTNDPNFRVKANADSVRLNGFAFDSVALDVDYTGLRRTGRGTAELGIFQDSDRDYRLGVEFELSLERSLARLTQVAARFDTTTWTSTQPGTIEWGGRGVAVESIELVSEQGGRIFVDGTLPVEGAADLDVELEQLEIAQISALLQDSAIARGLLTLDAHVTGTRAAPTFDGDFLLAGGSYRDRAIPNIDATFAYADTRLTADAQLTGDAVTLLTADASVPIDLALERDEGPRLLDAPLRITAHADSLPLEALPSFTEAIQDVQGRLRGDIEVAGTPNAPDLSGTVDLDLASLRIVEPGIALTDIAGTARLANDRATIDSLVAMSDGGAIRVDGAMGLETLTQPSFDLAITANNGIVLNSSRGRLRADLDLTAEGPYDAVLIAGDVRIRSGVIQAPETGKRRVTDLDDPAVIQGLRQAGTDPALLPEPDPLLANLRLDLAVRVDRDTWVRNSDGNVEIYTPPDADPLRIHMNRGEETLSLEGVINADRGEYSYAGHSFDLTTGSVTFIGGREVDPLLQLTARKEVTRRGREALVIQIHVLGTMSEPRIALESNAQPPLPESDLLAYLAFGRSSSSLLDLNDSGLASDGGLEALGALAQQQIAGLGLGAALDQAVSDIEREGTRAGLDVFRIRPAPLPEEVAFESYFSNLLRGTELEAGKYLNRRFFVSTQVRPSSALPGVRVEYRLGTGFTWESVWEPSFLPSEPSLRANVTPTQTRTFGSFLRWQRRF